MSLRLREMLGLEALKMARGRVHELCWREGESMASLDLSQFPAVESVPGKVCGAWVFKDTRMPVATVFENLEAGLTVEKVMEEFCVHGNRSTQY